MVDLESLQRLTDSKTYPHLVSGVDVDNIRKIVDANPSLFSKSWEENGSKRRDSGAVFIREYKQDPINGLKDVEVKSTYGFFFNASSGTGEYNLWGSNHVYRNPILNYYMGSRVLVFDPENPTEIIEEHLDFDTFPMFSASRKYICDFVGELTGNNDTGDLLEILNDIDSLSPATEGDFDLALNYMIFKKKTNSVEIHLYKSHDNQENILKIVEKMGKSNRTKFYNNCKSTLELLDQSYNTDNVNCLIDITFGPEGVEKNFGQSLMPTRKRDAPLGTEATDNFEKFSSYKNDHISAMRLLNEQYDNNFWLPDNWRAELDRWEDSQYTQNVFAVHKVNTRHEGNTFRLAYAFVGNVNGREPS